MILWLWKSSEWFKYGLGFCLIFTVVILTLQIIPKPLRTVLRLIATYRLVYELTILIKHEYNGIDILSSDYKRS